MVSRAEPIVIDLDATPEQQEIIQHPSRFLAVFAGRRWGKTLAVRNRMITRCLTKPGTMYLYAAPSYAQVKEEFDALSSNPGFAKFVSFTRTQPFPKIALFNGSQIYFRSLDRPALLRGGGFSEVWCDEIQDVDETTYDMIIRPLVADRMGTLGVSGQFRGTEDWRYKRCFLPGQDKTQSHYRSWRYATDTGYCFRSEEGRAELERIKATMPAAIYDQEFDCIPTANQRALFRTADLEAMRGGQAKAAGTPGMGYVIGLDIGRVVDPGSWVAYELETNTVVHAEMRPKGEKHEVTASYMGNASNRFQACPVVVDCTGGATGGHAEQDAHVRYYRDSIPEMRSFYWSRHNKEKIIHGLALAIEQRKFRIAPECTELFKQLAQYEYEYKGGRYDFHATQGCHDDLVSALAMAWDMVSRGWTPQRGGVSLGAAL